RSEVEESLAARILRIEGEESAIGSQLGLVTSHESRQVLAAQLLLSLGDEFDVDRQPSERFLERLQDRKGPRQRTLRGHDPPAHDALPELWQRHLVAAERRSDPILAGNRLDVVHPVDQQRLGSARVDMAQDDWIPWRGVYGCRPAKAPDCLSDKIRHLLD